MRRKARTTPSTASARAGRGCGAQRQLRGDRARVLRRLQKQPHQLVAEHMRPALAQGGGVVGEHGALRFEQVEQRVRLAHQRAPLLPDDPA